MKARRGERGAALVVTLIFTTAMAAAAVSFVEARQSDGLALRAQVQAVEAEAMIEAALQQTAALLANRASRQPIPGELNWRFGTVEVNVRIEAETGKIDLNSAEEPLLQGLLLALERDDDEARAFAQTVLDWRDENPTRRVVGAEDRDYDLDEHGASGAGDRPFAHAAEVRYLPLVDRLLWARLEPLVTIYSGAASPNGTKASETVRRSLAIARGLSSNESEEKDRPTDAGAQPEAVAGAEAPARTVAGTPPASTGPSSGSTSRSGFNQEPGRLSGSASGLGAGTRDGQRSETAGEPEEGGTTTEDSGGVQAIFLNVRFANGYEAAARAVIGFEQSSDAAAPFTVLDWTPILRERSGAL
jgi:general secretion pathway protein K